MDVLIRLVRGAAPERASQPVPARAPRRRRFAMWVLLLPVWIGVTACLSLRSDRRTEPSFPHRVHVVDNKLACAFCHAAAKTGNPAFVPPPELCDTCHSRFDAEKPPERRVAAFFDQGRYKNLANSARPGDVQFSHALHAGDQKIECATCHGEVGEQDEVPLAPLVQKAACMDCHARYGKKNACAECHDSIDQTWVPPSHQHAWIRGHGDVVRAGSDQSADRCALCHQERDSCAVCHQRMAPESHDNTFRLRTHGVLASIDRSGCGVCHTQDSCIQCHQETRPRSHHGGFGSPANNHCVGCHLPVQDTSCRVCHKSTPSHDAATPLPPGHVPSMNCRLCHGAGVVLPHPDGGHVCTACHR